MSGLLDVVGRFLAIAGIFFDEMHGGVLPVATCTLNGVQHNHGQNRSFASVTAEATGLRENESVVYEIRWDVAVAPPNLGHLNGSAGFVTDEGHDGQPVGIRGPNNLRYQAQDDGTEMFQFVDDIQQAELNNGSWWFRLRVINEYGDTVTQSQEVQVNWTH